MRRSWPDRRVDEGALARAGAGCGRGKGSRFRILHKRGIPQDLAGQAERILNGRDGGWNVDGDENANPKHPKFNDLFLASSLFGLPEAWVKLDAEKPAVRNHWSDETTRVDQTLIVGANQNSLVGQGARAA